MGVSFIANGESMEIRKFPEIKHPCVKSGYPPVLIGYNKIFNSHIYTNYLNNDSVVKTIQKEIYNVIESGIRNYLKQVPESTFRSRHTNAC